MLLPTNKIKVSVKIMKVGSLAIIIFMVHQSKRWSGVCCAFTIYAFLLWALLNCFYVIYNLLVFCRNMRTHAVNVHKQKMCSPASKNILQCSVSQHTLKPHTCDRVACHIVNDYYNPHSGHSCPKASLHDMCRIPVYCRECDKIDIINQFCRW